MATIMVVDDDPQVRELLATVLRMDGHEVTQACDGVEAVALCHAHAPDLAVIDLIMPQKEGIETIRELRREYPDMRILAISGGGLRGTGPYLQLAERLGADMGMPKPLLPDAFSAAVADLLGRAPAAGVG